MAKLFIAVVPMSECEGYMKACMRAFRDNCPSEERISPKDRDANYYMMDCGKYPKLDEILLYNIEKGKCSAMSSLIAHDPIAKNLYGLYRAKIMPDDYTLEDFINEAEAE